MINGYKGSESFDSGIITSFPTFVNHHTNGDSDFTFPVTMRVGAEDSVGSSVVIGEFLRFNIKKIGDVYIIQESQYGNEIDDGIPFNSKQDAINYLLKKMTT